MENSSVKIYQGMLDDGVYPSSVRKMVEGHIRDLHIHVADSAEKLSMLTDLDTFLGKIPNDD